MRGQVLADLLAGIEGLGPVMMADHPQRHLLDEADVDPLVHGESDQVRHLVVIAPAQDDGVELDALEAGRDGGVDPGQHLPQLALAGDLVETPRVEAVEADVDPPDPGGTDVCGQGGELEPLVVMTSSSRPLSAVMRCISPTTPGRTRAHRP